ncbi:MAG: hypothetical protein Q8O24_06240 [Gallionellaceae bacterium]|nr:hypothetical protein [Gallionellaceae bacterium]
MTDQIDQAQEHEQMRRDIALREQALKPKMPYTGQCYNCEAEIKRGCFCDADCRDDYERREKLKVKYANAN